MKAFPAALAAAVLLFIAAAPFVLQGDPSSLRTTQVEHGITPDSFEFEGHGVRFLLSRGPSLDPGGDVLLIIVPDVGYTDAEVELIRDFVWDGGRLLVAGDSGSSKELLDRLDIGVYLTGATLYTPVFSRSPDAMISRSTGLLPDLPAEVIMMRPIGVEGGESILRAPDPSWSDENGNGRPDLGEPLVAASVLSAAPYGKGLVVVVGDGLLFHRPATAIHRGLIAYLGEGSRVLVIDAAHRSAADPLGVSSLMAGSATAVGRTAILITVLGVGAFTVLRPRISKTRRDDGGRAIRRFPPELVGEVLSELHAR